MSCYLDSFSYLTITNTNIKELLLLENGFSITYKSKDNHLYFSYNPNKKYQLFIDGKEERIEYRFIYKDEAFFKYFPFDINHLGSFYHRDHTIFNFYAPLLDNLELVINHQRYQPINNNGTYYIEVKGDLEGYSYYYLLYRNNEVIKVNDPFSYAINEEESIIIDLNKLNKQKIKTKEVRKEDIIIYELSVRDFSSQKELFNYPISFKALLESDKKLKDEAIGIDYLTNLGITHLQLMPIFDFYGTDKKYKEPYNWGYNPLAYNVLNELYVEEKNNPYAAINEFRSVINFLHQKGTKVCLDVVFNHVYKDYLFDLNTILPSLFFRYQDDILADGSYCGNEIATENSFVSAYFNLMIKRYIELYDIDGLRFDLMGLLDIDFLNKVKEETLAYKNDFLLYGEGWKMSEVLIESGTIDNADKLKDYAFFNGEFRDLIKGLDYGEIKRAYLSGDGDIYKASRAITSALSLGPRQSINYLECHDNHTFYDFLKLFNYPDDVIRKLIKMSFALILFTPGIPFIHAGEEFMRTKKGYGNSYNLDDSINKLDWYRMVKEIDLVNDIKELIGFYKQEEAFHLADPRISFEYYYEVFIFQINNLKVYLNNSEYTLTYPYHQKEIIIYNEGIKNEEGKEALIIGPYSFIVTRLT